MITRKNPLGVPLIMIRALYRRNTESNPAPNFQWTHSHFIGNDLPSQIHYTLLWSPRQKTCGRSSCINSFFVGIPSYTLHVLGSTFLIKFITY